MPNVPGWFQARDYFGNKLATMSYADADNGAQQLMDAFNAAGYTIEGLNAAELNNSGEQLYRHFVDYGNAENISPNNYFNVDYYIQQKLDQLKGTNQQPPFPFQTWNVDSLKAALQEAGLSYWDHYAKYGTIEGLDPSAQFDTNAYLEAKAKQLNDLPEDQKQLLPDGTSGEWTAPLVAQALANADLSALEHYYDYGRAENVQYQPLPEVQPEIYYKSVNIADMESPIVGTGENENFIAVVGSSQSGSTLTPETFIDGNGGIDKLTVTMDGSFRGFAEDGGLKGINEVALVSSGKGARAFDAEDITGVNTWSLDETKGVINLANLSETGTTVNVKGLAGKSTTKIGFAGDVADGTDDTMTIGLENVGSKTSKATTFANIDMDDIENVAIIAKGDSYADLSDVSVAQNIAISGEGNLEVDAVAAGVETVDASRATGNLDLDLSAAEDFQDATLGAGNDKLTITNLEETSSIDGGAGKDVLVMDGVVGIYGPELTDVETLTLNQQAGANPVPPPNAQRISSLYLDGTDITGLDNLVVKGLDAANPLNNINLETIFLENYNVGELNVKAEGNNGGNVEIADIDQINFTVGGASRNSEVFSGVLKLDDTSVLNVTIGNTTENGDIFSGVIDAGNVESLSIVTNRNNLNDRNSPTFMFQNTTNGETNNLSNVSDLTISGFGAVNIADYSGIGSQSEDLEVDASGLKGVFTADFKNTLPAGSDTSISITGAANQNYISVTGYNTVNIEGSKLFNDTFVITGNAADTELTGSLQNGDKLVLMGTGWDIAAVAEELGIDQTAITATGSTTSINSGLVSGGQKMTLPSGTAITDNSAASSADYSGVTFGDGNGTVTQSVANNGTLGMAQNGTTTLTTSYTSASPLNADYSATVNSNSDLDSMLLLDGIGTAELGSGKATIAINNTGSGTVSVPGSGVSDAPNLSAIKALTLNTGLNGGDIDITGTTHAGTVAGTVVPNTLLSSLENLTLSGSGDVGMIATVGAKDKTVTIDGGSLTGNFDTGYNGGIILTKGGTITLGSGNDYLTVSATSSSATSINLGNGSDHILFNNGLDYDTANSTAAKITLDLGSDSVKDIIDVYAKNSGNNNYGTFLSVDNFQYGTDVINSLTVDGDTPISAVSGLNSSNFASLVQTAFGQSSIAVANPVFSEDTTMAFVSSGSNSYNVFMLLSESNNDIPTSAVTTANKGQTLVMLNDVNLVGINVSDLTFANFSDFQPSA